MRIYFNQLATRLQQQQANIWLVFGDEPWQKSQALQQIKQAAAEQGFIEVIRLVQDEQFDWQKLINEYQALSLFSSKRIIELELTNLKINNQGIDALTNILATPTDDVILLIHGDKVDAATSRKKWFKTLTESAIYLPLYPLENQALSRWLQQQAKQYQLQLTPEVSTLLLTLFEGNLMAMDQELQKLALLFGHQPLPLEQVEPLLINQAKFDPFQLIDAWLNGDLARCFNILQQLQQESQSLGQLLWFIHKELKLLLKLKQQLAQGENFNRLCQANQIWDKRKPVVQKALQNVSMHNMQICLHRLADIDLLSKTTADFNGFLLLADLLASLYHGDALQHFSLDYEIN